MLIETDLIWMSLCIFLPTAFALALLFFPRGSEEYMRWWTLLGTSATFVVSMILFINYLKMLDTRLEKDRRPNAATALVSRAEAATRLYQEKGERQRRKCSALRRE